MSELPAVTTRWLAAHHGVITTTTLREHGVGPGTYRRLVAAGSLKLVAKGVLVVASAPVTAEQRMAAMCAAHPSGFITGPTAGMLAGLRRMPKSAPMHMSVRHGVHYPTLPGVQWRQSTVIWEADRVTRDDGITVASWPRLAFDLAADLRPLDHVSVVQQMLHERRVTGEELVAIDKRLGHPGRPGSGTFRRTIVSLEGRPANQSHPEVVLAEALRRWEVPIEHQTRLIRASNGQVFHVDLAVPEFRWGVELDIHPEHRSYEGHAADAERRREMHRLAWQVETVSEHDMRDPDALASDLARLFRLRRASLLAHPSVS